MTDTEEVKPANDDTQAISMVYRNWRGEVGIRTIRPSRLYWGSTEWHPEPGWLLEARDCVKMEDRTFALADCVFDTSREDEALAELERAQREECYRATPVLAALAAAISLLEKGGREAAPSDKMFEHMLADYRAVLEEARANFENKRGKEENTPEAK